MNEGLPKKSKEIGSVLFLAVVVGLPPLALSKHLPGQPVVFRVEFPSTALTST